MTLFFYDALHPAPRGVFVEPVPKAQGGGPTAARTAPPNPGSRRACRLNKPTEQGGTMAQDVARSARASSATDPQFDARSATGSWEDKLVYFVNAQLRHGHQGATFYDRDEAIGHAEELRGAGWDVSIGITGEVAGYELWRVLARTSPAEQERAQ